MRILFICLGNTCRSPMAESIMKQKIRNNHLDWFVDSAALRSWNDGCKPNSRCLQVLTENGLSSEHISRMIKEDDFYDFDYILGMDEENIQEINELRRKMPDTPEKKCLAKVQLLGSYTRRPEDQIIRDPYFSGDISAFRHVFVQISESCNNFIKALSK